MGTLGGEALRAYLEGEGGRGTARLEREALGGRFDRPPLRPLEAQRAGPRRFGGVGKRHAHRSCPAAACGPDHPGGIDGDIDGWHDQGALAELPRRPVDPHVLAAALDRELGAGDFERHRSPDRGRTEGLGPQLAAFRPPIEVPRALPGQVVGRGESRIPGDRHPPALASDLPGGHRAARGECDRGHPEPARRRPRLRLCQRPPPPRRKEEFGHHPGHGSSSAVPDDHVDQRRLAGHQQLPVDPELDDYSGGGQHRLGELGETPLKELQVGLARRPVEDLPEDSRSLRQGSRRPFGPAARDPVARRGQLPTVFGDALFCLRCPRVGGRTAQLPGKGRVDAREDAVVVGRKDPGLLEAQPARPRSHQLGCAHLLRTVLAAALHGELEVRAPQDRIETTRR
ncbi:MAG: hypothetical protein OXG58_09420 [Gemmatimonadetes bacterium]|nr:hypothetical protein [Gemmatimonadota bacterium]MCY3943776.1 hypothetical protein [Gemmatimonadota bacterium]